MFEGKKVKVLLSQAGSGKTRALMAEIENELKTRRSEEIAFVTYTKKGVEEGVRRACNAMNLSPDDLPYFCTLHALTFRALGYKRDQVFNRIQQNKFNKKYGYNLNVCEVSSRYNVHPTKDTEYFNMYEAIRSGSITSEQYASSEIDMEYLHHFAHDYEEFKVQECLTDFTDCLVHYVQNGVTLPVKVAMIDECQDITALQWKVIEIAFAKAEKIFIAGDENQCLYTYNGARPDFLINFAKKFQTEYLSISHRIPKQVYYLAKGIVDLIDDKTEKPFDMKKENVNGEL